ncbi:lipid-A-disaccharide synthase [uncultured Megasphaera sp.]|uniref:lipid-A-disaccharide synthase n=1 Tax=uncultured Megasphaera sp. TaxID=165188 RepID=UPI00259191AF|nr:lipid-A-disaccharide synthase [uncultured Megasphaera sp.]
MKIMFSVGEASGDLHGAALAKALVKQVSQVEMIGMGGKHMASAGVHLVYDIQQLGVVGIGEVIRKIPFFFRLRTYLLNVMRREKPDILICIDYPGFNMQLMKKAKALGIPVIYYILPTIWAWNKSRGNVIARYADLAISLFPFEAQLYKQLGTNVIYAGHPLLDMVQPTMDKEKAYAAFGLHPQKKTVLCMPGSRLQEVQRLLPVMMQAVQKLQQRIGNVQCIIPRASTISRALLERMVYPATVPIHIGEGNVYDMMQISTAAVVASGTATLETALMEVPTVLVYKVNRLTYTMAKLLVHVKYIGLPNIIMGRRIMPELWQDKVTPQRIVSVLQPLLTNEIVHERQRCAMAMVRSALGSRGSVDRIAMEIVKFIKERS